MSLPNDAPTMTWAGGFFAGTGSIFVQHRPGQRPAARLKVSTNDLNLTSRFVHALGHDDTEIRKDTYHHRKHDGRVRWEFILTRQEDVAAALEALRPHLGREKQAQADEALHLIAQQQELRRKARAAGTK